MSMFSTKRFEEEGAVSPYGENGVGTTIIAHGVRVEGDFTSKGDVQIEGDVQGHVETGGMLTVGPQAKLTADVRAESAVIAGSLEGNLTVASHLDLKATAKIAGDVTCETASIESGASLNGKVAIGTASAPKSTAKTRVDRVQVEDEETEQ